MSTAYRKLFNIGISHTYYTDGAGKVDFAVRPTSDTLRNLAGHHMRFVDNDAGLAVLYRVDGSGAPFITDAEISANLRLRFTIELKNAYFFNYTDLAITKELRNSVYYFDGSLVTSSGSLPDLTLTFEAPEELDFRKGAFTYVFTLPGNPGTGTLRLIGPGGSIVQQYTVPRNENNEYIVHVEMSRFRPGRYALLRLDNGVPDGSEEPFYFDTEMNPAATFGVIEIGKGTLWSDVFNYNFDEYVDSLPPTNEVPAYAAMQYVVAFSHRSEQWVYKVVFKKTALPSNLNHVTIEELFAAIDGNRYHQSSGDYAFVFERDGGATDFDGYDMLTFKSIDGPLPNVTDYPIFQETKKNLNLKIGGDTVYGGLPNPDYKNFKNEVIIYV
jgi:hypothetical protein